MEPVKQNDTQDDSSNLISLDQETIKTEPPDDLAITHDSRGTEQVKMKEMYQKSDGLVEDVDVKQTVFEVNPSSVGKQETITSPLHCGSGQDRMLLDGEASCASQTETKPDCPVIDTLFTCEICCQTFKQHICLTMHLKTHLGDGPYTCDVCSKIYKLPKTFLNHISIHNIDNQFDSQIYDQGFHSELRSKGHQKRVLRSQRKGKAKEAAHKNPSCDFCDCSFPDFEQLKVHVATHQQKSPTSINTQCNPSHSSTTKRRATRSETLSSPRQIDNQTTLEQSPTEVPNLTVCEEKSKRKRKLEEPVSVKGDRNTKVLKTLPACHQCVECGEIFTEEPLLRKHLLEHLKKEFKVCCGECGMKFTNDTKLKQHTTEIHTKIPCKKCDRWLTPQYMRRHSKIHNEDDLLEKKPFQCDVCEKVFSFAFTLKVHMNFHDPKNSFDCEVCCRKFIKREHLDMHFNIHTQAISLTQVGQTDRVCQKNSGKTDTVLSVGKATEKQKNVTLSSEVQILSKGNIWKCDVCKRVFWTNYRYKKHILICKRKSKTECQICPKKCVGHSRLQIEKSHRCDECGKVLHGETPFRKHILEHFKKVFVFNCDECGMKFTSESKLQHHTTEKHTKVPCTECDQLFTPEHMRRHLKVHKGNGISKKRPFQCDVCDQVFGTSRSLKQHMNFHDPKETFSCEVCCRKFTQFWHLKSHMKTHPQMQALSLNRTNQRDAVCKENNVQTDQLSGDEKGSQRKSIETSPQLRVSVKGTHISACEMSGIQGKQVDLMSKNQHFKSARNKLNSKDHTISNKTGKVEKLSCDTKTGEVMPRAKANPRRKNVSKIDAERSDNKAPARKKKVQKYSNKTNKCGKMGQCNKGSDENERVTTEEGNTIVMLKSCKKTCLQKKDRKGRIKQNRSCTIRKTAFKLGNRKKLSKQEPTRPSTQQRAVTITKHSCGECGESFTEKDLIDSHMIKHLSELYTFQCDFCSTRLLTNIGLKKHVLKNHTETPCAVCGQMFDSATALRKHAISHSDESSNASLARKEKTRKILLYSQRRAEKHEYYNRYCSGTSTEKFACPVCEKLYDRSAALLFLGHVKYHTKWLKVEQSIERDILRNKTGDELTTDTASAEAMDRQNINSQNSMYMGPESKGTNGSTICQNSVNLQDTKTEDFWNSSGQLQDNMGTHAPETSLNDKSSFEPLNQVNDPSTGTEGDLLAKMHEEQTAAPHAGKIQVWTVRKLFQCVRCKLEFKKEYYWKQHNNVCSDEMMCDHCGKVFMGKRQLQLHMQRDHLRKVTRVCHICGDICKSDYAFNIHNLKEHSSVEMNSRDRKKHHLCEQCGTTFSSRSLLWKHQQLVHHRKGHSCDICGKSFVHEIVMKRHLKAHKIATDRSALQTPVAISSTCDICGERMMERSMKKHRQLVHNITRCDTCGDDVLSDAYLEHSRTHLTLWNCDTCGKQFQSAKNVAKHKACFHIMKLCDLCEFVCESNQQLTYHKLSRHSARKRCSLCSKSYKSTRGLQRHTDIVHTRISVVTCHICGKTSDKYKIERHMRKHGDLPQCPVCCKKFLTNKRIERHIWEMHRTSTCDACGKEFTHGLLKHHKKKCLNIPTNKMPEVFKCQFCGIICKDLVTLKVHLGKHLISKSHACTKCDKKFDSALKLTYHQRVHTIMECKDCGEKFESRWKHRHLKKKCKSSDRTNRSVDNDAALVKCNICGKGFKTKSQVQRHMFSHTRAVYACQLCKFATKSQSRFERHGKTHKKKKKSVPPIEKEYSSDCKKKKTFKTCSVCNKEIKHNLTFQRHMATHTGVNTFECSICGRGFPTKAGYKYHLGAHLVKKEKIEDANKPDENV
ncbi:zinc finger protein 729-like [Mizuhopecten yessoensis]|uniref:Zinc finger protein 26 n=1 Tax=Mizuhopecten yessoensis TaxID=6573 RepID=A0A210Q4Q6_MIZYE|nr:zinc finger protein 729-like [Mizuhopecten yessoensis]OWF43726.1 Zinc finger protein 26 [Mizuhopecten yessoensis]